MTGEPLTIGEGVTIMAGTWTDVDCGLSKPVAMTVTRISPCMAGS